MNRNAPLLNSALLSYVVFIMLFITFFPFDYHWPSSFAVNTYWKAQESLQNIFFFIPFGYLLASLLNVSVRQTLYISLISGFFLSLFIELNQIFIVDRYSSPIDLFNNSVGALAGAAFFLGLKRLSALKKHGGRLLDIPLMNLVLMLIPLLWLNAVSSGHDVRRLWLAFILALIALRIMTAIYLNGARGSYPIRRSHLMLVYGVWYAVALLPELLYFPGRVLAFYLILMLIMGALLYAGEKRERREQRFELPTLGKIGPLFLIYLLLEALWPLRALRNSFEFEVLGGLFRGDTSLAFIFSQIEYFAAFALTGFIAAQILNRHGFKPWKHFTLILVMAVLMELPRGFHGLHSANLTHIFLAVFNGTFGALIYFLNLSAYLEEQHRGNVRNDRRLLEKWRMEKEPQM